MAVIVVLAFVTLSYLEVVKVYTKAGGAYVVARENFGLNVAQVAAVSLLIDYTLTVAVSVAAGVAALTSVFPALTPGTTWIAVGLVLLIAFGNLRGVREAGRVFAHPHVLLHRQHGRCSSPWAWSGPPWAHYTPTRSTNRAPSTIGHPGTRAALRGRRSSWCCAPSPRAGRP